MPAPSLGRVFLEQIMEIVEVRIIALVVTSRYGSLSHGDLLRTDAAFARHLVEDCAAAEYIHRPAPAKAAAPVECDRQEAGKPPASRARKPKADK
jgi:hypothetical protein